MLIVNLRDIQPLQNIKTRVRVCRFWRGKTLKPVVQDDGLQCVLVDQQLQNGGVSRGCKRFNISHADRKTSRCSVRSQFRKVSDGRRAHRAEQSSRTNFKIKGSIQTSNHHRKRC